MLATIILRWYADMPYAMLRCRYIGCYIWCRSYYATCCRFDYVSLIRLQYYADAAIATAIRASAISLRNVISYCHCIFVIRCSLLAIWWCRHWLRCLRCRHYAMLLPIIFAWCCQRLLLRYYAMLLIAPPGIGHWGYCLMPFLLICRQRHYYADNSFSLAITWY